jgi:hypothetical protein
MAGAMERLAAGDLAVTVPRLSPVSPIAPQISRVVAPRASAIASWCCACTAPAA